MYSKWIGSGSAGCGSQFSLVVQPSEEYKVLLLGICISPVHRHAPADIHKTLAHKQLVSFFSTFR